MVGNYGHHSYASLFYMKQIFVLHLFVSFLCAGRQLTGHIHDFEDFDSDGPHNNEVLAPHIARHQTSTNY